MDCAQAPPIETIWILDARTHSFASSSVFLLTLKAPGTRFPSCSQRAIESLPPRPGSARHRGQISSTCAKQLVKSFYTRKLASAFPYLITERGEEQCARCGDKWQQHIYYYFIIKPFGSTRAYVRARGRKWGVGLRRGANGGRNNFMNFIRGSDNNFLGSS